MSLRLLLAACLLWAPAASAGDSTGVLVLAHGGSPKWNTMVLKSIEGAGLQGPVEVAFGMGMMPKNAEGMQHALDALKEQGASRAVVVPLLVSSASMVMRQFEYLFGFRSEGSWEMIEPLDLSIPVLMARPMDADPLIAEILLERAVALSTAPATETVILVAHGPNAESDQQRCLLVMQQLADSLRVDGGFRDVIPVTMRDDAPKAILEAAIEQMREMVQKYAKGGTVLVIPLLIASGGIEAKIPQRLEGLDFIYKGVTLLPHPKVSEWIHKRVDEAVLLPYTAKQL